MAQTGVPFGEVDLVSSWLGIGGRVERPPAEHPRKPVDGFACRRSEVSGRRLWGLFRKVYGTPEHLFRHHFVVNYCPLLFLDHEGRNITPDKLSRGERDQLFPLCDRALRRIVAIMQPRHVIGVGGFAAARVAEALAGQDVNVGRILHPSPANPQANRGWENAVLAELAAQGINLPSPPAADIDGTRR
jgi:single-strand selective monofunctional uracil DNA glycosylase